VGYSMSVRGQRELSRACVYSYKELKYVVLCCILPMPSMCICVLLLSSRLFILDINQFISVDICSTELLWSTWELKLTKESNTNEFIKNLIRGR
jgi:hypothetical protein